MKSLQANVNIRFDERDRFKIKKKIIENGADVLNQLCFKL